MIKVLCPSRGRPDQAKDLLNNYFENRSPGYSTITIVVNKDDPKFDEYDNIEFIKNHSASLLEVNASNMCEALNIAANKYSIDYGYQFIMFIGDDHRFRTPHWDKIILDQIWESKLCVAYCNDLLQGQNLPTQVIMSSKIIKALGYMALPELKHLYIDNFWKEIGENLNSLIYFNNIIIEHMHPGANKAKMDEHYERVNSKEIDNHDRNVFLKWKNEKLSEDIDRIISYYAQNSK